MVSISRSACLFFRIAYKVLDDRRYAESILELLLRDEFPALWRRPSASNQILGILRLRLNLVRQRTQVYNRLQAFVHNAGLPKGRIKTPAFQALIKAVETDEAGELAPSHLFRVLGKLDEQIGQLEE